MQAFCFCEYDVLDRYEALPKEPKETRTLQFDGEPRALRQKQRRCTRFAMRKRRNRETCASRGVFVPVRALLPLQNAP